MNDREPTSGETGAEPSEDNPPTTEGEKWTFFDESSGCTVKLDPPLLFSGDASDASTPFILFIALVNARFAAAGLGFGRPPISEPGVATVLQLPGLMGAGDGTSMVGWRAFGLRGGVWGASVVSTEMIGGTSAGWSLGVLTLEDSVVDGADFGELSSAGSLRCSSTAPGEGLRPSLIALAISEAFHFAYRTFSSFWWANP